MKKVKFVKKMNQKIFSEVISSEIYVYLVENSVCEYLFTLFIFCFNYLFIVCFDFIWIISLNISIE